MPHITFPRSSEGYELEVVIGLAAADVLTLQTAGQPIPPFFRARALLDTATDMTAVAPRLLQPLGCARLGYASTHTAGGMIKVNLYDISLTIHDPAGGNRAELVQPQWRVTDFLHAPQIDVLLGLDFADLYLLLLDGPRRCFTLGF